MATLYLDSGGAATNSGTSDNNSPDLSGAANATVVSNKTFVDANVNTATDVITVTGHGYSSGTGIELTTSGALPAGLTLTTLYYICNVTVDTITLHTNVADAEAGTNPVNITAAAGGGTHTINNRTINLGGTPDLSGVKCDHCRVTTTGTSHVFTMAGGIHGFANGDEIALAISSGGTMPGGVTSMNGYYVNALTTTTFRIYSTSALAISGGASDINVTSAEVRTLSLFHSGSAAIACDSATNSNKKIFFVKAISNTNDLVVVDATVTGLGAGSNWAIGGRVSVSGAVNVCNAARAGDTIIQNTDLSAAALVLVLRAATRYIGKAGARRLLASTSGSSTLLTGDHGIYYENLELQHQGTGGVFSGNNNNPGPIFNNVHITDSGSFGMWVWAGVLYDCLITGTVGGVGAFYASSGNGFLINCHVRDNAAGGVRANGVLGLINSIVERTTGIGVNCEATNLMFVVGSTIYRGDNHGVAHNTGLAATPIVCVNSILKDNGNASSEANIRLYYYNAATRAIIAENVVNISGGRGGVNVIGFDLPSGNITTDPLFVDPDAAAGSRNFGLQSGSPAKGLPYTFNNSLSVSYRDLGAVQRQESGGAGGGLKLVGTGGLAG